MQILLANAKIMYDKPINQFWKDEFTDELIDSVKANHTPTRYTATERQGGDETVAVLFHWK